MGYRPRVKKGRLEARSFRVRVGILSIVVIFSSSSQKLVQCLINSKVSLSSEFKSFY